MPLKTTLSDDGRAIDIAFSGSFDINKSLQIQEIIKELDPTVKTIRIDLQQVTAIDSSVFSTLLLIYYEKNTNAKIEITNCSKTLAHRFSLAGIDRLLTIRLSALPTIQVAADDTDIDESKNNQ